MPPRTGTKAHAPRSMTGCLTCRKRKVKCDEAKPICKRCQRVRQACTWSDELQFITSGSRHPWHLSKPSDQNFVAEMPGVERRSLPYIHHFITFCSRFLTYQNDGDGNPFQKELVPLASSSPALHHSMIAVAAAHLSRTQSQHNMTAFKHYSMALRELSATLSNPILARLDSTLGACLLLCVYEVSHSENCLWLNHLQGARDLILFRGGPKTNDYLSRFFALLDVSGSLFSGGGPLIQGNYWIDNGLDSDGAGSSKLHDWPYFDNNVTVTVFNELMIYMVKLSRLSSESMSDLGHEKPELIIQKAAQINKELWIFWNQWPPSLRNQSSGWRQLTRPRKLTVTETLAEEAISSTISCMYGCIVYLHHILNPLGREPQSLEVIQAISVILENAREVPAGHGLEMGHYWGLFMAGVSIFNDIAAESLIRQKLKSDVSVSIYHANRALDFLEVLWKRQHQHGTKYDWRQVQAQMKVQVFIFA